MRPPACGHERQGKDIQILTTPNSQQHLATQPDAEYIRIAEFPRIIRVYDNLFCGISNIAATFLQLVAKQHDAGNDAQLVPDNHMNDPVIFEELGMMPTNNAEVNENDAKFDADHEDGFENEEVDLGPEELVEVASVISTEWAHIPNESPTFPPRMHFERTNIYQVPFSVPMLPRSSAHPPNGKPQKTAVTISQPDTENSAHVNED